MVTLPQTKEGHVALVITKKQPAATVAAPTENYSPIAALIEAYGTAVLASAPTLKKIKELQALLQPVADAKKALEEGIKDLDLPDDVSEALIHLSPAFRCEIGSKGSSREITDLEKAKELLGQELFMKIAKINLGDLDKYLTLPQRELVIQTKRTTNTYKVEPRVVLKPKK